MSKAALYPEFEKIMDANRKYLNTLHDSDPDAAVDMALNLAGGVMTFFAAAETPHPLEMALELSKLGKIALLMGPLWSFKDKAAAPRKSAKAKKGKKRTDANSATA